MKRRNMFAAMLMIVWILIGAMPVLAASGAPKVESCKCKAGKKVEVEFAGKVQYKNPAVKVLDASGKKYEVKITDKDDDDIEFKVKGLKAGKKYTYKISGIRKKGNKKYTTVKGSFRVAKKTEVKVDNVEYDKKDKEVSFDFQGHVKYKKVAVEIKDAEGKAYVKRIKEKDRDEIEVSVKKLKKGKKYQYKITGVAKKGSNSYKTVKGTFTP